MAHDSRLGSAENLSRFLLKYRIIPPRTESLSYLSILVLYSTSLRQGKKKKKNKKCHISSFRANGNQTDGHETDFPSNLKIVPVTLPIPISTTCMIACTFMSRVFQDRQALKSSEWVFVPAEFGIPCLYLRIQRFLSILGLMKRWARYHSR